MGWNPIGSDPAKFQTEQCEENPSHGIPILAWDELVHGERSI
jgi:hypothetical protein